MKKINRKILHFKIMNDFINIPLNLLKEEGIFQIYIFTFLCDVFLLKFLHSFVYLWIRHNSNLSTVSFIFKLKLYLRLCIEAFKVNLAIYIKTIYVFNFWNFIRSMKLLRLHSTISYSHVSWLLPLFRQQSNVHLHASSRDRYT